MAVVGIVQVIVKCLADDDENVAEVNEEVPCFGEQLKLATDSAVNASAGKPYCHLNGFFSCSYLFQSTMVFKKKKVCKIWSHLPAGYRR